MEAAETGVKLARRWAYDVKKVPENRARVVFAEQNFWGRSLAAVSASSDPECFVGFGPFVPNFDLIPYDDLDALDVRRFPRLAQAKLIVHFAQLYMLGRHH